MVIVGFIAETYRGGHIDCSMTSEQLAACHPRLEGVRIGRKQGIVKLASQGAGNLA